MNKNNQLIPACCNLVTRDCILLSLILINCSILLILSSNISMVDLSYLMVLSFSNRTSFNYWFWLIFLYYVYLDTYDFYYDGIFFDFYINPFNFDCVAFNTRYIISGVHVIIWSISFLLIW
jgi:hypothetical protein